MQTIEVTDEIHEGHTALAQAVEFACRYHVAQVRKGGGVPYVSHLLQVAGLVLEYGGSFVSAVAAVLHDVVEDTTATLSVVRDAFGDEVADIVSACTDTVSGASGEAKEPWRMRKERHLAKLEHVSLDAAIVIACDKLHNLRTQVADMAHGVESVVFNASLEDRAWLNAATLEALAGAAPDRLMDDLADVYVEWRVFAGLSPYETAANDA